MPFFLFPCPSMKPKSIVSQLLPSFSGSKGRLTACSLFSSFDSSPAAAPSVSFYLEVCSASLTSSALGWSAGFGYSASALAVFLTSAFGFLSFGYFLACFPPAVCYLVVLPFLGLSSSSKSSSSPLADFSTMTLAALALSTTACENQPDICIALAAGACSFGFGFVCAGFCCGALSCLTGYGWGCFFVSSRYCSYGARGASTYLIWA